MVQSLKTGKKFNIRILSKYSGQTVAAVTLDCKKKTVKVILWSIKNNIKI